MVTNDLDRRECLFFGLTQQLEFVVRFPVLVPRRLCQIQQWFHRAALRARIARIKRCPRVVVLHRVIKNLIDKIEHTCLTSKIAVEINAEARTLLSPLCRQGVIAMIARAKNLRLRQSEHIDALLDIADRKKIAAALQALDQRLLDHVAVLIFIDENMQEFFTVKRRCLRILENFVSIVLDVVEIQESLFPFFFRVDLTVAQQRPREEAG